MSYAVLLTSDAERQLGRLGSSIERRVRDKLVQLAARAGLISHEALTGSHGGLYRLRVGHYRAIYQWDRADQRIIVHRIGHRREIYGR